MPAGIFIAIDAAVIALLAGAVLAAVGWTYRKTPPDEKGPPHDFLDDGRAGNSAAIVIRWRLSARYAQEKLMARGSSADCNGDQAHLIASLAMRKAISPDFTGYWQQHLSA